MTNENNSKIGRESSEERIAKAAAQEPPPRTVDTRREEAAPAGEEVEPDRGRLAGILARLRRPTGETGRESKTVERTRALVLLVGGTVGCLLLFFALFTTDGESSRKERKSKPSLGRPEEAASTAENANRSPVPQLTVNPAQAEQSGELTETDVLGTMRNRGTPITATGNTPVPPAPTNAGTLASINFDDPALADAYRRQGLTPPPQRTDVTDWNVAIREYQEKQKTTSAPLPPPGQIAGAPRADIGDSLRKSSMVFVRAGEAAAPIRRDEIQVVSEAKPSVFFPQGAAFVARFQQAVNSAVKTPVVAVIEYNYEDGGRLLVPAGTKVYGELAQATPQGWVTINFREIEFPNGDRQKINGSAIGMDRQMIRGDVNGKKTAIKVLTRALTGVGTIAAYAVGGRSANGGIDSSILLRERVASNLALAGEQQMASLAYQQNIVVTVPARTQFYLVLNEPSGVRAVNAQQAEPTPTPVVSSLTDREIQELLKMRNEMREMNKLMQQSIQTFPQSVPQQQEER